MPEEVQQDQIEQQPEVEAQSEDNDSGEVVAPEEPQESEAGLPDGVSDRTRQEFEKLKESNKRLKQELEATKSGQPQRPSVLEAYLSQQGEQSPQVTQPQLPKLDNVSQATVQAEAQKLIDEQGYLDANELERRLTKISEAEQRALEAERRANQALERVARFEIDSEKKRLHEAYPEIDPSSDKFNPDAYELVKNKMLDQLVATGKQDALQAAAEMERFFRKPSLTSQQQEVLSQRTQASSGIKASGNANQAYASDFDELRKKSLTSDEAMDERIRRAGI